MKLIIQIPCFNEEKTLPIALKALPTKVDGFDLVEYLIIDDGSIDNTVKVARDNGVHHIISFKKNQGLAKGFMAGLDACLKLGADIIINTDADNQYNASDIPKLIDPILNGKFDMVIGERPILNTKHFSFQKKILQKLGSWTVRIASNTNIPDAPSGFRAFSKSAAMKLNVFNDYTYTIETIIQAGHSGISTTSVKIQTNEDLRPSKLVKSIPHYIKHSIYIILKVFTIYKPYQTFFRIGLLFLSIGLFLGFRWLYFFYILEHTRTHLPSLILASIIISLGIFSCMLAIISDLLSVNRQLLEDIQLRIKKIEMDNE